MTRRRLSRETPETPFGVPAMVSVATLTKPIGAAVFVDDELVGASPAKVPLAGCRTVLIRAEHPGREPTEDSHVVGDRAETFRLALPLLTDAGPTDSTIAVTADRPEVRPRPGSGCAPTANQVDRPKPTGSGASFNPERIAE